MIRTPLVAGAAGVLLLAGLGPASNASVAGDQAAGILAGAPAASAEVSIVNDEVVLAQLDPTGLPERAVLVSRVTVQGPEREVVDPASQTNVRYLDRLGRPAVSPDGVVLVVGGEQPRALTEARFDKPLPVAIHAQYAVDGQVVPAADLPGMSGEITVTYTLTNTTAEQTELTYEDADGQPQTSEQPVFVPFQGSLTATLAEDAELVDAPDAMLATDEQGRTVARWNISLFPPISTPIQELTLTMRAERAAVPGAQVLLTPAGADQDPATDFSADLLGGTTSGNSELYDGLSALDAAAGDLADGSAQLAQGLNGLAGGADEALDASESLARGIDAVAGGAEAAADASGDLATGVGGLAAGADEVSAGSQKLAGALGQAAAGAQDLADATAQLSRATAGSPAEELAPLIEGGAQIEAGLLAASARIGSPGDPVLDLTVPLPPDGDATCPPGGTAPPDDDCVTIYQGVRALRDGLLAVDEVVGALEGRVDEARDAFAALVVDLRSIGQDVTDAAQGAREVFDSLCTGSAPTLDPASEECAQLLAIADAADSALATAAAALPDVKDVLAAIAVLEKQAAALSAALDRALASTEALLVGVAAVGQAVGTGTPTEPGLATAMAALNAGLAQLSQQLVASQAELNQALDAIASGSQDLAGGIDGAAQGAGTLVDGSQLLADGAQAAASGADALAQGSQELARGALGAASGAGQLSSGLGGLAAGAGDAAAAGQDLTGGATALQEEGTQPAAEGVLDASSQAALAQAWLDATAERAQDALPYGPPVGAQGNVAYVFTLDEVPAPRSFWERIRAMFGG